MRGPRVSRPTRFLNPDASFAEGAAKSLAQRARVDNALVGPLIVDEDGLERTRARFWSTPVSVLGEVCLPTSLNKLFLKRDIPPEDAIYRDGGRVPYVQGTCMAVGAENFWRGGGFDERLFLYHEEEMLARSMEQTAVSAVLEPAALITHLGARSTFAGTGLRSAPVLSLRSLGHHDPPSRLGRDTDGYRALAVVDDDGDADAAPHSGRLAG